MTSGCHRPLQFPPSDREVCSVAVIQTALTFALLMLLSIAAGPACMKVIGFTLIAASVVIPPTVARLLTNSFKRMLIIPSSIGAFSGLVGMYLSYHLDISSGAAIVLTNFAAFAAVFAATGPKALRKIAGIDASEPVPNPRTLAPTNLA